MMTIQVMRGFVNCSRSLVRVRKDRSNDCGSFPRSLKFPIYADSSQVKFLIIKLKQLEMPKIADITVPSIGFGLMSLGHMYGNAGTDEERFAVSTGHCTSFIFSISGL